MATTPEAEELAAVLRRLKDRSKLSYGVLAGKLHVSTSTLHRYCNGDAVPAEFAPLERLARLCGAQREELVDLHRRWILADEARRRGRAGTDTAAAAAGGTGAETADPPEPRSASAAQQPELPPADAVGTRPGDAVGTPPGDGSQPADAVGTRPGDGSRRKRLLVALAASAVVVLAVPVAVVASNGSGSGGAEGKDRAPAEAVDPTGSAAPGSASGAASAPASAPVSASALPSSSSSRRPAPSASRGSTNPSAKTGRQGDPPDGGVPLRVGISSYNWDSPCGQYYLLDRKPDGVPPPPAPQDHRSWARALGGIDAGRMHLQLTATGRTQDSVVISAVHVRTVARGAALARPAYSMGEGCGSGVTPRTFDIDLDAGRPVAKPVAGTDGDLTVPAKDFPYKVASNDPQVLNFDVHTEGHDVSWYLEVAWSSGDRSGTVRIDDGGSPFRVSAIEGRPLYDYWPDKSEWVAR
ncbi:helix-turn-helix domain-containing protein [Streptomyces xantholiticus]|uniref:helix-turn-helix domain-containing protein n=1 Tax=Streptomyces xantholiticus TaxID=68285 RepID=UPI001E5844FE|nr:helix-turn-helix transcriptional regulator [Streptomyces xantholiticus]